MSYKTPHRNKNPLKSSGELRYSGRVGKTSILHRFMFGTFQETYMETVEDIHLYHVNLTGKRLFVNFLDTAAYIHCISHVLTAS
jgi:hypothetical protein